MPVNSPTMAHRPRVSVKVNSAAFGWFDHICRWFGSFFHPSRHNQPPGFYGTWDARRELFHQMKADAALDLVVARKGVSWSSQIYGVSL
jgi:hypothetical protein